MIITIPAQLCHDQARTRSDSNRPRTIGAASFGVWRRGPSKELAQGAWCDYQAKQLDSCRGVAVHRKRGPMEAKSNYLATTTKKNDKLNLSRT